MREQDGRVTEIVNIISVLGLGREPAITQSTSKEHTSGRRESRKRLYKLRMDEGGRRKYYFDHNGSLRRVAC